MENKIPRKKKKLAKKIMSARTGINPKHIRIEHIIGSMYLDINTLK